MHISQALIWITQEFSKCYPHEQSSTLARHLLEWALSRSAADLLTHPNEPIKEEDLKKIKTALSEHLENHKPLQYIFTTVPFLSANIVVRPPVLIPRPETEHWVLSIIKQLKKLNKPDLTLLDMCSGSGCIAVVLAHAFPQASIYAVDSSPEAVALTRENAAFNNCPNITTIQSDLFTNLPPGAKFDCIVSNPPYVTKEEWKKLDPVITKWEDLQALVAEDEGLEIIKKIISQAPQWLSQDPLFKAHEVPQLLIEIGEKQGAIVKLLMEQAGFKTSIHPDDVGKDRFVTGYLP